MASKNDSRQAGMTKQEFKYRRKVYFETINIIISCFSRAWSNGNIPVNHHPEHYRGSSDVKPYDHGGKT